MTLDLVIRGDLVLADGMAPAGWVGVRDGVIAGIGRGDAPPARETADHSGKLVFPGIVDGQTHAGAFDIAYLGCLPGMVLMAAADEAELVNMVRTAVAIDDRPSGLRYPRGEGFGVDMPEEAEVLPIGKGRVMREGSTVAILSYGARLYEALKAAEELAAKGISTTVADARFAKPLDEDLILRLAREHEVLITIEEGSVGGFASQVLHMLALRQVLDGGLKIRPMVLPDLFLDHDKPQLQYEAAGLNARHIVATALEALGRGDTVAAEAGRA